jgi:hypothetical protein
MSDKKDIVEFKKEIMRFLPSSSNTHKNTQPKTARNVFPQGKQGHFSPNAEVSSRTRKFEVQIDKIPDLSGELLFCLI